MTYLPKLLDPRHASSLEKCETAYEAAYEGAIIGGHCRWRAGRQPRRAFLVEIVTPNNSKSESDLCTAF